jgi:hypothetical protein
LYVVMGARERWLWQLKRWMPVPLLSRVARRVRKDLATFAEENDRERAPSRSDGRARRQLTTDN